MARTTHVARAQQRFETVPVIDPETGEQKVTPVMRNGVQRTTKKGKPITMKVTVEDRSKPKPLYVCDFCRNPIEIGQPYKWIQPKSGPYGGSKRTRHESCPNWAVWEYSSSLSARLAEVAHTFSQALDSVESEDDVQSALDDAASEVTQIAEEKREGASNIEEGFGHPTSASEELESTADELENWASEIEGADIPEFPEPEERYFIRGLDGGEVGEEDGYETEEEAQAELDALIEAGERVEGDGAEIVADTPDEPSEEQVSDWRDEVRDALSLVDESPV